MTVLDAPRALLRNEEELPFVPLGDGTDLQLLQVDVDHGVWVVRTRWQPGAQVQTHKHTGPVYAFTHAGAWNYLEYPDDVNVAGSFLFEPAGSVHTLQALPENSGLTDAVFVIHGANLNLDAAGNVEMVIDAGFIRDIYLGMCEGMGLGRPPVVGT